MTVIVPTYNREKYALELLSEFEKNQKFLKGLELLLVSGDENKVVRELQRALDKISLYIPTNLVIQRSTDPQLQSGLNEAIVEGIQHSRGEYITVIADDNSLHFSYLSRVSSFLSRNEPLLCRFGWYDNIQCSSKAYSEVREIISFPSSYFLPQHLGAVFKRETILRIYNIMRSDLELNPIFNERTPEIDFIKTEIYWLLAMSLVFYSRKSGGLCLISRIPFAFQTASAPNISQNRMKYPWWTPPFIWEQFHARLSAVELLSEIPALKVSGKDKLRLKSLMFRDVMSQSAAFYGGSFDTTFLFLAMKFSLSRLYCGFRKQLRAIWGSR